MILNIMPYDEVQLPRSVRDELLDGSTSEIDIDYNYLGQAIDTSWGRSSTPMTSSRSVKFTLAGQSMLIAKYITIVNFSSTGMFKTMKAEQIDEAEKVVYAALAHVKAAYKDLAGRAIKVKETSRNDDIEIIGMGVHSPLRRAYYRATFTFDVG